MKQETKGQSKVTVEQVVAIRRLKAQTPELTVAAIKDQLNVPLSTMAIGRIIRGILHSQVDMCGLPVTPFTHKPQVQARIERKEARKRSREEKRAVKDVRTAAPNPEKDEAQRMHWDEYRKAAAAEAFAIALQQGKAVSMEVAKNAKGGLEFSKEQVEWIKSEAGSGRARKDIAADLSVSLSSVARILQGSK